VLAVLFLLPYLATNCNISGKCSAYFKQSTNKASQSDSISGRIFCKETQKLRPLITPLLATLVGQPNSAFKLFKAWVCYQFWSCASVHLAAKFSGQKIGWHMPPRVFAIVVLALVAK
jgi:hypothetical protein